MPQIEFDINLIAYGSEQAKERVEKEVLRFLTLLVAKARMAMVASGGRAEDVHAMATSRDMFAGAKDISFTDAIVASAKEASDASEDVPVDQELIDALRGEEKKEVK